MLVHKWLKSQKKLGPKKFWVQRNLGPKNSGWKIILGPKIVVRKKIWVKNDFWSNRIWVKNDFWSNKIWVQKYSDLTCLTQPQPIPIVRIDQFSWIDLTTTEKLECTLCFQDNRTLNYNDCASYLPLPLVCWGLMVDSSILI